MNVQNQARVEEEKMDEFGQGWADEEQGGGDEAAGEEIVLDEAGWARVFEGLEAMDVGPAFVRAVGILKCFHSSADDGTQDIVRRFMGSMGDQDDAHDFLNTLGELPDKDAAAGLLTEYLGLERGRVDAAFASVCMAQLYPADQGIQLMADEIEAAVRAEMARADEVEMEQQRARLLAAGQRAARVPDRVAPVPPMPRPMAQAAARAAEVVRPEVLEMRRRMQLVTGGQPFVRAGDAARQVVAEVEDQRMGQRLGGRVERQFAVGPLGFGLDVDAAAVRAQPAHQEVPRARGGARVVGGVLHRPGGGGEREEPPAHDRFGVRIDPNERGDFEMAMAMAREEGAQAGRANERPHVRAGEQARQDDRRQHGAGGVAGQGGAAPVRGDRDGGGDPHDQGAGGDVGRDVDCEATDAQGLYLIAQAQHALFMDHVNDHLVVPVSEEGKALYRALVDAHMRVTIELGRFMLQTPQRKHAELIDPRGVTRLENSFADFVVKARNVEQRAQERAYMHVESNVRRILLGNRRV